MKYLLIICHDESFTPTGDLLAEIAAWDTEMQDRGIRLDGNPLRPPHEATTVRVREGVVTRASGPFAATAEQIAAYELVDCVGLDEAVEVAARHPMARAATIEIRPVWAELAADAR